MKKGLVASYVEGIRDHANGEGYIGIVNYFVPEFITSLVLYSLLFIIDAQWIAHLRSTSTYATLGITNTMLHFIVKMGEGLSVGAVVLGGQYNGAKKYKDVGSTLVDVFWVTFSIGGVIAAILFFGARWIYVAYGIPPEMVEIGIPFLRMRAIGIFLIFLCLAFTSFLRGIKNTKAPMQIFILGAVFFLFFDYALIFGKFGFPELKLRGSAMASVIQYSVMLLASVLYVLWHKDNRKYCIQLFGIFRSYKNIIRILRISWPVVIDKATIAGAYLWLGAMIAPMGKCAIASFNAIKDLERLSIVPAVALAQVVTFLVSNAMESSNWVGIKSTIKKILLIASTMVFFILLVFSLKSEAIIQLFDKKRAFTDMAATAFPILSVLVFCDLLQLVLSGALRGAGNVRYVMLVRLLVCGLYFAPASYVLSTLSLENEVLKFILVYGSFYVGNAIMSVAYIRRFRTGEWKEGCV